MSRLVASFDPSAGSGTFTAGAVNKCSTLWVMNESPNFLALDFGGAGTVKIIQPWYNAQISLTQPANQVNWSVVATLQSGSAPVSVVYVELFDPAEDVSALTSGPLFRQSNVGNAAAVSASASAVQNDGNAANTTILEGTPSGAASSQALITNDGRAILGGGLVTISAAGVFTAPAGAIPGASVGGAVPDAQSLNNQVTSSDNGTAQLYSTVDGRGIALGYKDSGGTYHQVLGVDGSTGLLTAPAGALPANAVGAGYPAGNVGAGTLPAGVDLATIYSDGGGITSNGVGNLTAAGNIIFGPLVAASQAQLFYLAAINAIQLETPQAGATPQGIAFGIWTGGAGAIPFSVGGQFNGAKSYISVAGSFVPGGGGSLNGVNSISGSGSATVNHGLSAAPQAAVVNTANGSNSTTFGSGSYTATTVYIYEFNPQAWTGLVYRS